MRTYLFYDVETSGLNPAFDQILTFAGIRTDLLLNEIERQTITVKFRKDIVPSPAAFLTHGLTMEDLSGGMTEYQAAKIIHKAVNAPGTISLGYNSLGFDDEFLRFLFYRNLLDPYSHQYGNGCSRMDILPVTTLYKIFYPSILNWPMIDSHPSLKLELISQENHFITSGRAHEAQSDVEALIQLTKELKTQKDIWVYCQDFFNKTRDEIRIKTIEKGFDVKGQRFLMAILVSASFGPKANYLVPAVNIGDSVPYQNQSLWLRLDADDILGLEENRSIEETFVIRKRFGDGLIVLPQLERFMAKMSDDVRGKMQKNILKIQKHPDRLFAYIKYHTQYAYPFVPEMDIDARLYQDGFFTREEKNQINLFHAAYENKDGDILNRIKSPRIQQIARRILMRNDQNFYGTDDLDTILRMDVLSNRKTENQIMGYKNDVKLTCREALSALDRLEKEIGTPDEQQGRMLCWLRQYINALQVPSA